MEKQGIGGAEMRIEAFTEGTRQCKAFVCEQPEFLLIQPVDESDAAGLAQQIEAMRERTDAPFALVAFSVGDWNGELSPWDAPPVFGKTGFGHGAADTLAFITETLLPHVRARYEIGEDVPVILGGYSLAAFFALWATYRSDTFHAAAAASPSVWFPGWMEFAGTHECFAKCVYLSLGDREERAKNPVMATVGDCIRQQHQLLLDALGEESCTLEWNEGNHFKDPALRCAKAFAWCIEKLK